jgi:hypothetical protein
VPGRVRDDELPLWRGKITVSDVDRDPLLALCLETVEQQSEVERTALGADGLGVGLERRDLVFEQELGLVEQTPDQRALAVIDAPTGDEMQEVLVLQRVQALIELGGRAQK